MKTTLEIEKIRKELEEKRAVLSLRMRVNPDQPDAGEIDNPDRAALAQDYVSKERQNALNERMEETLEQVKAALARIDEGKYGKCTQCGKQISPERLEILPYAEHCIDCQEQES
jgi:RNA polymerase-binding protein DksA